MIIHRYPGCDGPQPDGHHRGRRLDPEHAQAFASKLAALLA
jgi:hypothetical protein